MQWHLVAIIPDDYQKAETGEEVLELKAQSNDCFNTLNKIKFNLSTDIKK